MSRGVSVDELVRTNVVSDDGASADEAALAQSHTANDRCVRAHGDTFFDPRFHRCPVGVATARREIIGQHGVWTKKHVVCYVHVLPDADAVFDRDVVADGDAALDVSVIADVAVRADNHVLKYMSKRPDASTFADRVCFA